MAAVRLLGHSDNHGHRRSAGAISPGQRPRTDRPRDRGLVSCSDMFPRKTVGLDGRRDLCFYAGSLVRAFRRVARRRAVRRLPGVFHLRAPISGYGNADRAVQFPPAAVLWWAIAAACIYDFRRFRKRNAHPGFRHRDVDPRGVGLSRAAFGDVGNLGGPGIHRDFDGSPLAKQCREPGHRAHSVDRRLSNASSSDSRTGRFHAAGRVLARGAMRCSAARIQSASSFFASDYCFQRWAHRVRSNSPIGGSCPAFISIFVAPWAWLSYRSSGTLLYPLFEGLPESGVGLVLPNSVGPQGARSAAFLRKPECSISRSPAGGHCGSDRAGRTSLFVSRRSS